VQDLWHNITLMCAFLQGLSPAHDWDVSLVQLAMNREEYLAGEGAARIAARKPLPNLEGDAGRTLLFTASTRQHAEAFCSLIKMPVMQQQIDAATLEALLPQLDFLNNSDWADCSWSLLSLPAAQQLSSTAMMHWLQAAVVRDAIYPDCLPRLRQLPAAQQLSTAAAAQLQDAAVQAGSSRSLEQLCMLPAAQHRKLDSLSLLSEAEQQDSSVYRPAPVLFMSETSCHLRWL
jgi:hypothetical protein